MWLFKVINSIGWSNSSSYRDDQIFDLNKKFQYFYKKVKHLSYEAVSSSKFDTDDVQISFQIFD